MELEFITAGTAVNTHGIRGEVKILPQGVEPELLAACGTLYLGGKPFALAAGRIHKGCLLAKLKGVEDMDAALALKNKDLYIRREDARLPEGEYFDDELLGLRVVDDATGAELGELVRVDPYPAHRVYTVRGSREYLIPAVPGVFIQSVDLEENRMRVTVWEGMASDEN